MTIIFSWNHAEGKQLEEGKEYAFVERMRRPNSINPYRAMIQKLDTAGDKVEMELLVTKPDRNKRYSKQQIIVRNWPKKDASSGTTLIYNHYEVSNNSYPNSPVILFDSAGSKPYGGNSSGK